MFRKVSILAAIVAMFSFCYRAEADEIPVSWDGGGDGHSWGDANNWDPNIVPHGDFAVSIANADVRLQENRTINRLYCSGNVELQKWTPYWVQLTLNDSNGLTNYGDLEIDEIEINGNVTNTAGARLELGDVDIGGNLYNQPGATIEVGEVVDVYQGDLENAGLIEIAPSGEIYANHYFNNVGEIVIYGGECGCDEGTLDNNSSGVIKGFGVVYVGFGVVYGDVLLRNKGQIIAFGGSLAIGINGALINTGVLGNWPLSSLHIKPSLHTQPVADVNNFGTIEVNASGGVAFDCNLMNVADANIILLGGTLAATTITQAADANFAGFGGITGDVVLEPNASIELTGPTNIVGDVNIPAGATLEISDGTTLITGHTTCNNGTIHMIGGRIICQGGLTNNNCNIIWEPGTYTNIADFNLDGTVNFKDFADFANTWLWRASWY